MKPQYLFVILICLAILFCCRKENRERSELFFGQWKTSYGDTILFSEINGKNILSYNVSLNAFLPVHTQKEFIYRNKKLGLKTGVNVPGNFSFLETFKWHQTGKSFEVQGIEWFPFLSSTLTYYTFTKIP